MGVFSDAIRHGQFDASSRRGLSIPAKGLAHRILERLRTRGRTQARLVLLERISLAPRQTVALIEADGQRLLVATSPEGAAAFYPLSPQRRTHQPKSAGQKTAQESGE